jgi:hypothetical protein
MKEEVMTVKELKAFSRRYNNVHKSRSRIKVTEVGKHFLMEFKFKKTTVVFTLRTAGEVEDFIDTIW